MHVAVVLNMFNSYPAIDAYMDQNYRKVVVVQWLVPWLLLPHVEVQFQTNTEGIWANRLRFKS